MLHEPIIASEPNERMSQGVVDGYPREVWWNADGETVVESYTISDMAHVTPLGVADVPLADSGGFALVRRLARSAARRA